MKNTQENSIRIIAILEILLTKFTDNEKQEIQEIIKQYLEIKNKDY